MAAAAVRVRVAKRPASEIGLGPDRCVRVSSSSFLRLLCRSDVCVGMDGMYDICGGVWGWMDGFGRLDRPIDPSTDRPLPSHPSASLLLPPSPDPTHSSTAHIPPSCTTPHRGKPWAGELPRIADAVVAVPGQVRRIRSRDVYGVVKLKEEGVDMIGKGGKRLVVVVGWGARARAREGGGENVSQRAWID